MQCARIVSNIAAAINLNGVTTVVGVEAHRITVAVGDEGVVAVGGD